MAILVDELYARLGWRADMRGLQKFEKGIARARQKLDTVASVATKVGAGLTAAATAPVLAYADFEAKMTKLQSLVGASDQQVKAWTSDIIAWAAETGKTPSELADALFYVSSAQLDVATTNEVMLQSAKASVAGLGEQSTIADAVTSAIGAYGVENLSAAEAVDQMLAAVREGKLAPEALAGSLSKVLAPAAELNVQFSEATGILAALSRQGFSAEQGSTTLRGILSKMIKPTEAGKKKLEELGLSMEGLHAEIEEKGLLSALRTLRTAFGDDTEALGKFFEDVEGLNGVLALTGPAANEAAQVIKDVADSAGITDEAFALASDTIKFQWTRTLALAQTALILLGEELAPTVRRVIDFGQKVLEWFNKLDPVLKEWIAGLLAMGPVLLGVGAGAKAMSFALGGLVPIVKTVLGVLRGLWVVVAANPVLALIAALALLYYYWDDIRAAIDWAAQAFVNLMREWGVPVDDIFAWINAAWQGVLDFLSGPEDGESIVAWVWRGVTGIFGWLTEAWDGVVSYLSAPVEGLWAWIYEQVPAPFQWLMDLWLVLLAALTAPAEGIWGFLTAGENPFGPIIDAWTSLIALLAKPLDGFLSWLGVEDPDVFGWLSSAFDVVIAKIKNLWRSAVRELTDLIPDFAKEWLGITEEDASDSGRRLMETLGSGINRGRAAAVKAYEGALDEFDQYNAASDARKGPLSRLTASGRAIMETLAQGMRQAAPLVDSFVPAARDLMSGLAPHLNPADLMAPLPVAPAPAALPAAAAPERGPTNFTITFDKGAIVIQGADGDPQAIAERTGEEIIRRSMRALGEQLDSKVES